MAGMLESMIGPPGEDAEDAAPAPGGDAKARKLRALKSLASALGVSVKDPEKAAQAFADAVDACLEYESDDE